MTTATLPIQAVAAINPAQPRDLSSDLQRQVGFVPMANVGEDGTLRSIEIRSVGELLAGYTYFADGDVIVAKITPCLQNGKAALVSGLPGGHGFGSTEFHVLRAGPKLDKRYLFYMVWSPDFRRFGEQRFTGSAGQKRMPASAVAEFGIPIPFPDDPRRSLAEQKRIAAILDKADAIRRRRQEAARLADTLIPSVFYEMFGDPVLNPHKWDKLPLVRLCADDDDIRCGPFGTQLHKEEFTREGVPLWGIKHVNAGFALPTHEFLHPDKAQDLAQYSIEPGDIVMTRKGTIGNCAVYPKGWVMGIMHSDLLRLRVDQKRCHSVFLSHQLHYSPDVEVQLDRISGGAIMQGVNVGRLKALSVLVPPVPEQARFVKAVEQIEALQTDQTASATQADGLFNALVQRAFRGEL